MTTKDICPSRDDAQPHIFEHGRCTLCLTPVPAAERPLRTSLNGVEGPWPPSVWAKWRKVEQALRGAPRSPLAPAEEELYIRDSNYFTPRPAVDEYNRGSREEGFTYTISNSRSALALPSVWQSIVKRHERVGGDEVLPRVPCEEDPA